jgi:hypothetical protein
MKLIISLSLVILLFSCAQTEKTPPAMIVVGGIKVSTLTNKDTHESLVFTRKGENNEILNFNLEDGESTKLVKTLTVQYGEKNEVKLLGEGGAEYDFEVTKKLAQSSKSAYAWCWNPKNWNGIASGNQLYLVNGYSAAGVVAMAGLCATIPGIPFIAAIIVAPIEGLFVLGDKMLNVDKETSEKFSEFVRGKNVTVSNRIFKSIIKQLSEL